MTTTMPKRCMIPDCPENANTTWALVPVCQKHRDQILKETDHYYDRLITYNKREIYQKISCLIPWSQRNMGVRD